MDVMQPYEVPSLIESCHYSVKQEKENTRKIMWSNVQPLNKHRIDERKLIPLPTDKSDDSIIKTELNIDVDKRFEQFKKMKEKKGDGK